MALEQDVPTVSDVLKAARTLSSGRHVNHLLSGGRDMSSEGKTELLSDNIWYAIDKVRNGSSLDHGSPEKYKHYGIHWFDAPQLAELEKHTATPSACRHLPRGAGCTIPCTQIF